MPSIHMQRALALAQKARHHTSPNPMVGAVLVKDGTVVGEGYHRRAGGAHAEAAALRAAGQRARGAVLYVTLEPCVHQGRTPPCADALVGAGVSRVVAAMRDPDQRVAGKGFSRLRRAGIEVEIGDGANEAAGLNLRYLRARRERRAFVALKWAMTLDGKTATKARQARWITGVAARREAHRLRSAYDAVAVGATTILEDDPELTARDARDRPRARQPLRLVIDGRLRVKPSARVLSSDLPGRTLVATSERAGKSSVRAFETAGVALRPFGRAAVEPEPLLRYLQSEGVNSVLVEGGGETAWTFVNSGVVDRVYAFIGPSVAGGRSAPSPVAGEGFAELQNALRLEIVDVQRFDRDVLIDAVPSAV